ncbi:unnamed protein product, partial [Polarella glacialis]
DPDGEVRRSAVDALGQLGSSAAPLAGALLRRRERDLSQGVRRAAAHALQEIAAAAGVTPEILIARNASVPTESEEEEEALVNLPASNMLDSRQAQPRQAHGRHNMESWMGAAQMMRRSSDASSSSWKHQASPDYLMADEIEGRL